MSFEVRRDKQGNMWMEPVRRRPLSREKYRKEEVEVKSSSFSSIRARHVVLFLCAGAVPFWWAHKLEQTREKTIIMVDHHPLHLQHALDMDREFLDDEDEYDDDDFLYDEEYFLEDEGDWGVNDQAALNQQLSGERQSRSTECGGSESTDRYKNYHSFHHLKENVQHNQQQCLSPIPPQEKPGDRSRFHRSNTFREETLSSPIILPSPESLDSSKKEGTTRCQCSTDDRNFSLTNNDGDDNNEANTSQTEQMETITVMSITKSTLADEFEALIFKSYDDEAAKEVDQNEAGSIDFERLSDPFHGEIDMGHQTDTDREVEEVDYACLGAGGAILDQSGNFKGASNLLTANEDEYAIVPCPSAMKFVVIGLPESVLVQQVILSTWERYSSQFKEFRLAGSTNMDDWSDLGYFTAHPGPGRQTFHLSAPAWVRYVKVLFFSYYGDDYYCTLGQISIHGKTRREMQNNQEKDYVPLSQMLQPRVKELGHSGSSPSPHPETSRTGGPRPAVVFRPLLDHVRRAWRLLVRMNEQRH